MENLHAAVARSTFATQKLKKNDKYGPLLDVHMSKNCRKIARRCGAKHIYKSKCTKPVRFAVFLEVTASEEIRWRSREIHLNNLSLSRLVTDSSRNRDIGSADTPP